MNWSSSSTPCGRGGGGARLASCACIFFSVEIFAFCRRFHVDERLPYLPLRLSIIALSDAVGVHETSNLHQTPQWACPIRDRVASCNLQTKQTLYIKVSKEARCATVRCEAGSDGGEREVTSLLSWAWSGGHSCSSAPPSSCASTASSLKSIFSTALFVPSASIHESATCSEPR